MARIPRLYRVVSRHGNGAQDTRHYQTPKAADERRERFLIADPDAAVTVTPSHPITFPHEAGDAAMFDIPDTIIDQLEWRKFARLLGLDPMAVVAIHPAPADSMIVVEYDTATTPAQRGKHAPALWRVYLE